VYSLHGLLPPASTTWLTCLK